MIPPTPYFSLTRPAWFPALPTWDPETGFFPRLEGLAGFADYPRAPEATRFLVSSTACVVRHGGVT